MAVLVPGKLLFLANPRTASCSTRDTLLQIEGAFQPGRTHHSPIEDIEEYNGELVVATVRNPYDVLVSWSLHFPQMEFVEFLETYDHFPFVGGDPPDLFWLCTPDTHVMRWETLQEDFDTVMDRVELPRMKLVRINATEHKTKPWREYYDAETIAAANERFGHIVDKWRYSRISEGV